MTENEAIKSAENILKLIGDNPSFDIEEFINRISVGEDWARLIVAHIYIDHVITQILNDHLPHPETYFKNAQRHFAEKLTLCRSLGYFRDDFGEVLRAINNARNKFAHELVFTVSNDEKRNLFRTLTKTRAISEVTRRDGFGNFLFTVVMLTEISRENEKRQADLSKEMKFVSGEILKLLIRNKGLVKD